MSVLDPARRWTRATVAMIAFAAVGTLAACAPAAAKANDSAPPPDLLVRVAVGPAGSLRGLQAYADTIQPGTGAQLTDQVLREAIAKLVNATSLDGFKPAGWTHILISEIQGAPAFALLGEVANAGALAKTAGAARMMIDKQARWAVIGPKPMLDRVGQYALSVIAAQPPPAAPMAVVYLPQVLARYQQQIQAFRTTMMNSMQQQAGSGAMGQLMTAYVDGLGSLFTDSDQLVVTLETTADAAALDFALTPRGKSRLAAFAALQRPSDYALVDRLPPAARSFLFAGHLELGPYSDGIMSLMAQICGLDASKEMLASMNAFRDAMTGDMAMGMQLTRGTGMAMTQLYGTTDPAAARKALDSMLDLFKAGRTLGMGNISATIKTNPGSTLHDGVALRSYDTTYDLSKVPPAQRQLTESMTPGGTQHAQTATFDDLILVVTAPDSLAEAKRTIAAARGKGARFVASKTAGPLLAISRAHKDSLAALIDLGAILGTMTGAKLPDLPMLMALGFTDRNVHLRFALPAVTLRGMMNAMKP
jgi:hypothetical protein